MKNFNKKYLTTIVLITAISFAGNAQTNVSGGIYVNTTWTKANSPYIVTDTVVVFPGVTLTIEPGVVVKFADNQQLEIRQGTLIANGTSTDSITFTSNSSSPTPGIYVGVYLNGDMTSQLIYCNFYYAAYGLNGAYSNSPVFTVRHCKIMYNINGISSRTSTNTTILLDSCDIEYNTGQAEDGFNNITNCIISNNQNGIANCRNINNCFVDYNGYGIYYPTGNILNCFIRHNGVGIFHGYSGTINNCVITNNQNGIRNIESNETITNCVIDSNSTGIYIHYNAGLTGNNIIQNCDIEYNSTGIDDQNRGLRSFYTKNKIDNDSIGILLVTTIDSFYCNSICNNTLFGLKYTWLSNTNCVANNYWCITDSATIQTLIYDGYDNISYGIVSFMPLDSVCSPGIATSVNEIGKENLPLNIYPNPAVEFITLELMANSSKTEIKIFNTLGELMNYSISTNQKVKIDISNLSDGVYILEVVSGENISIQKFIKQKNSR